MSVLIIADSRGDGLQLLLNECKTQEKYRVLTYRGTGLEMAAIRAIPFIKAIKPDLVIIFAGICDLTHRSKATKVTSLRHTSIITNVAHVLDAAKTASDLLHALGNHLISFATLTGLYLEDYNNPSRKHMSPDQYGSYCTEDKCVNPGQLVINESVKEINRKLTALNKANATPTVWTGGVVHSYFKNTHHHYYSRLSDGCHASNNTKDKWVAQIIKSTKRILPQIKH